MMGWYGAGMGGAGFMWIFMGLFWLALIALIVWLVFRLLPGSSRPGGNRPSPPGPETAEQILDRMLATGEIDEATYRARRSALNDMRRSA